MNICITYTHLFFFILIGYVRSSDKSIDKPIDNRLNLVPYSDSDDENFEVTETTERLNKTTLNETSEEANIQTLTEPLPQPFQPIHQPLPEQYIEYYNPYQLYHYPIPAPVEHYQPLQYGISQTLPEQPLDYVPQSQFYQQTVQYKPVLYPLPPQSQEFPHPYVPIQQPYQTVLEQYHHYQPTQPPQYQLYVPPQLPTHPIAQYQPVLYQPQPQQPPQGFQPQPVHYEQPYQPSYQPHQYPGYQPPQQPIQPVQHHYPPPQKEENEAVTYPEKLQTEESKITDKSDELTKPTPPTEPEPTEEPTKTKQPSTPTTQTMVYESSKSHKKSKKAKFVPQAPKSSFLRGHVSYNSVIPGYPRLSRPVLLHPRPTVPLRHPSNPGPGILGPAPGTLRFPSHILYKPGLLENFLEPREPTTQSSSDQSEESTEPTQPTETIQPTETTKEPTTESSSHQPTQEEPTKEPTKEPTQHTQLTSEPEQLQPETIPVEIGSDEDEEPPETPSGPGDGDQPPDKPEEGEGEDESGDGEDGEEKDEKHEVEDIKKCKEVKFLKKDQYGNLVRMTEKKDYKLKHTGFNKIKYEIIANLEQILCDEEVIFEHKSDFPYTKILTYNRTENAFVISRKGGFVLIKRVNGIWKQIGRRIPSYIKMYSQDSHGNYVELTKEYYYIEMSPRASIKYTFITGLGCKLITLRGEVIWTKTNIDDFPLAFSYTNRFGFLIYFPTYVRTYVRKNGTFKLLYTKKISGA
ncbi:Theileria-specific sub-telomeric protein, SVSP family, putative [Theileria annulata]|uniref:Theileria-specific sub-telomeric protein, SVSP family, putative n=1 Tax=Theileria annulata TaxID=5874 RepID=Q4UAS1_THEAN|nr:Theileria-specific sub-telomeric protein, SVSP family, putative [Theileria annulata]CAI76080.1 Theileria-specific sub-telomeric protein, SVSP family, putative [Theileria annulata]|eukprot:XP_952706.1 Theileria-specific sub-telomeric protein, SVSP family, putative [Theileria annulata]